MATHHPRLTAQELNEALLSTVQAVAQQHRQRVSGNGHSTPDIRFWIVTQGAQATSDESEWRIAQSSLWGFVRTLALEHQDWQTYLVDLDPRRNRAGCDPHAVGRNHKCPARGRERNRFPWR